jgi:hypothetical protein
MSVSDDYETTLRATCATFFSSDLVIEVWRMALCSEAGLIKITLPQDETFLGIKFFGQTFYIGGFCSSLIDPIT